MKYHKYCILFY